MFFGAIKKLKNINLNIFNIMMIINQNSNNL